jgi:hypothetical protein
MTLANGWTVSVQFGPGTITTNWDLGIKYDYRAYPAAFTGGDWVGDDAEIAAFYRDPDDAGEELRWYKFGDGFAGGTIESHCAPEDVIAWLAKMAALPKVGTDWVRVAWTPTTVDKEGIAAQDHLTSTAWF